jgi:hypothetical protein
MSWRKGTRVRFVEKDPTTWAIPKENAKHLELDVIYTVDRIEVRSWHTKVFLKEVPDVEFNSVWFRRVETE